MVELPYGRVPYPLELGSAADRAHVVVPPPAPSISKGLDSLLDVALDAPIGRPRLESFVAQQARVTVIVSDATRIEPRRQLLEALRRRLPAVRWTVAIATGTHGPSPLAPLDLPEDFVRDARVINHDGHDERDLVEIGTTSRMTPVRLHRCLNDTDLVIATGCIRPHYFAGFGAGIKAIFPGLGAASAIRTNHRLKSEPGARGGILDGNPCRADLEEAAAMLPTPVFLLDGVCAADDRVHAAVAGDPVLAFRAGAKQARSWFTVRAPRASLVIASDSLPISASLYQSAKIAAAVAPLVEANGDLVLVSECADGIGPLAVVNDAIFKIGVIPRLAPGVTLHLVSVLPRSLVAQTLVHPLDAPTTLVRDARSITIVPRASQLLFEQTS